ncbi:hypothetical protein GCM10027300_12620 [Modestobacter lapidis]
MVRNARGGVVAHHVTYELGLPGGRTLRTRISRPPNTETYGPGLWKRILTDQLEVSEAEFWACVSNKQVPVRETGVNEAPAAALPAGLVNQLLHTAGVPEAEVSQMSLERALVVMNEYWSRPKD